MPRQAEYNWPNSSESEGRKRYAIILGASKWKDFLDAFLPARKVKKYSKNIKQRQFIQRVLSKLIFYKGTQVFVWGFKEPQFLKHYKMFIKLPIVRIEDGFIRSVGLGAHHVPPLSLCFDERGIYFDARSPSDLEYILANYDFDADPDLTVRARKGIDYMVASGLSKYNQAERVDLEQIIGAKTRRRVLVLGQVEGDQSIEKGCSPILSNLDAVRIAREENPDAEVLYKPHPEVLAETRTGQSSPTLAEPYSRVLYESIPLADVFADVDHVYTITSLAGFEAVMRGLPVTCLGAPFYSGWGLTDDRQPIDRRGRDLTVEQVFAGAYILYSRYCSPFTREAITFEEALTLLDKMKRGEIQELQL